MKKIIFVEGMMCKHCQMHVESALKKIDGIKKAEVDLKKGTATIDSEKTIDETVLSKAISDAGYSVSKFGE
jgi:copper chaperone CopZ